MTRRRLLVVIVALLVGTLVVAGLTALVTSALKTTQIRGSQVDNTKTIDSSAETLKIIRGCTTPGEPCYDRGQKQISEAVMNINRVVILAAACASTPGTHSVEEIQACVIARLANKP